MPHDSKLIALIAIGFVLALSFGFLAARVRLPPLVGYLVAGIAIGPFTPGFVADANLASELAEIGVILLMFGVGLHFSMATLLRVRAIALPGAVAQIAVAAVIGAGLARWWGWDLSASARHLLLRLSVRGGHVTRSSRTSASPPSATLRTTVRVVPSTLRAASASRHPSSG